MSGRRHDNIWLYFHKTKLPGKTGCRAKCKGCGKEIQGLVARMKQHYTDRTATINLTTDFSNHPNTPIPDIVNFEERERATLPINLDPPAKRHKPIVSRMDNFVMKTSGNEKAAIDLQITRFVCATNSPFSIMEHPEFLKLITMLRPGYQLLCSP